ncbi:MAG: pilin, partial [Patescibacteria group bacterium]
IIFSVILPIVAFSFFIIAAPQVSNASLWDQQEFIDGGVADSFGETKDSPTDIRIRIVAIINVILTLLGIVTVVLIIFAGFKWMTAAGNEEQVSKAKKTLTSAVIGLIIILVAWSITSFILREMYKVGFGLWL